MKIVCNKETKRRELIKLIRHMIVETEVKNHQIACKIGQTEQSVSNLLNYNYRPESSMTVDGLAKICNAMDCDLILEVKKRDNIICQGGNEG